MWFLIVDRSCVVWTVDRSRVVLAGWSHSGCIHAIYLHLRALPRKKNILSSLWANRKGWKCAKFITFQASMSYESLDGATISQIWFFLQTHQTKTYLNTCILRHWSQCKHVHLNCHFSGLWMSLVALQHNTRGSYDGLIIFSVFKSQWTILNFN